MPVFVLITVFREQFFFNIKMGSDTTWPAHDWCVTPALKWSPFGLPKNAPETQTSLSA